MSRQTIPFEWCKSNEFIPNINLRIGKVIFRSHFDSMLLECCVFCCKIRSLCENDSSTSIPIRGRCEMLQVNRILKFFIVISMLQEANSFCLTKETIVEATKSVCSWQSQSNFIRGERLGRIGIFLFELCCISVATETRQYSVERNDTGHKSLFTYRCRKTQWKPQSTASTSNWVGRCSHKKLNNQKSIYIVWQFLFHLFFCSK